MSDTPSTLRELLSNELPRLYAFAYHMSGSRQDARAHVDQLVRDAIAQGGESLLAEADSSNAVLGLMARTMEENLGRKSEYSFEGLDDLLRSDITRPIDLSGGALQNSPGKVHLMLWELKRNCLTATLCCLPPGVRVSFVLTDLLGFSPADASALLGIKESAYRVRLTRARKRIEDYLTPRCAHVDPQNPCTCTGRLVIALDAEFIKTPAHTLDIPHEPHDADGPRRDMGSLYRSMPDAQLTPEEKGELLGAVP
ncbi:MAG: RNA polymerase sigma factor [Deltaproteobacteria bacterium]|nr:RNA polymerase sigma factor [Deltaproteobacteria bacterium]